MNTVISDVASLSKATIEEMYALHSRHFDNDDFGRFTTDLFEKQWVVMIESASAEGKAILGFSTVQEFHLESDGRQAAFMFSGDTIVDPSAWGSNALVPGIALFIRRFIDRHPDAPCFWFLICKGIRTYRCLPLFFKRFIPCCDRCSLPDESRVLGLVARYKFGPRYNSETGIISHERPHDFLNSALRHVPGDRLGNAHIRFFLERNPGWVRGDELACLAELSDENLRPGAIRVIEAGRRSVR
jgi:hypothetical protein